MRIVQVEYLLNEFDFDRVKKVMDFLGWVYDNSPDKQVTIRELRHKARRLLEIAYNATPSLHSSYSSDGFEVTRFMSPGETDKYLVLKFNVTEWSNPAC